MKYKILLCTSVLISTISMQLIPSSPPNPPKRSLNPNAKEYVPSWLKQAEKPQPSDNNQTNKPRLKASMFIKKHRPRTS